LQRCRGLENEGECLLERCTFPENLRHTPARGTGRQKLGFCTWKV
jgi:hypothetical protein